MKRGVAGGYVRLESAPRLLTRYQRVGRDLAIEHKLFDWCRRPIQYRERSDRMPAPNHRFKSSCDYRVQASGRFAPGTVLRGGTNRIIHARQVSTHPLVAGK